MQRESTVTEKMVERGAKALWASEVEAFHGESVRSLKGQRLSIGEPTSEHYEQARVVLEAALR